jgi:hypothetical protein
MAVSANMMRNTRTEVLVVKPTFGAVVQAAHGVKYFLLHIFGDT